MNIQMIGVDHTLAPVGIRERFSFTSTAAEAAMRSVCRREQVEGCVLLTTCNRTELWLSAQGELELPELLCGLKGLNPAAYQPYLVCRRNREAVQYLFSLASGLKSMILGEDQILAQVKAALARARELQCCGSTLEVLFRHAVTGAKRVKSQLLLSTANASAAELAMEQMQVQGYAFSGMRCLVIGNGEMGKRAAAALLAAGASVTVTVRQYRSGLVEVLPGCRRIDYGQRYEYLPSCDLVVSATSSPNVTIRAEELARCGLDHDLLLLDFAVPRDIDPAVAALPHVTLYNIDRFSLPQSGELKRQLQEAEELLQQELEKFEAWQACRDLIPQVEALGAYMAREVDFRIGPAVRGLALTREQDRSLTQAVESAAGHVLKKLMFAVRDEAGAEVLRQCLAAMEQVAAYE